MRTVYNILLLFLTLPVAGQDKTALMEKVLTTAKDYKEVAPVIEIIRKHEIYFFVPSLCPIREKYRISDYYGYREHPILKKRLFHSGIDLAAEYAAAIHTTAAGTVTHAGALAGYGKTVIVRHKYGFITQYSHLTYIYTKSGQAVNKGDVIGFVGSTGQSTGNHLHYEVTKNGKKINPLNFMNNEIRQ